MYNVEDFDVLRRRLTEREALVAAAVLPHLSDGECRVRVHDVEPPREYERPDDTRKFKEYTPTLAGTRLRRVEYDEDPPKTQADAVELTPAPHSIRWYSVSMHDLDGFQIGDDPDFDDTDQTFLSDFGVTPSPCDAVHLGVDQTDDTFERRPVFPV
jgi:hypothetical protein